MIDWLPIAAGALAMLVLELSVLGAYWCLMTWRQHRRTVREVTLRDKVIAEMEQHLQQHQRWELKRWIVPGDETRH